MANTCNIDWILHLQCSTCWNFKQLNETNFRKNSNGRWFYGYRSQCRECERARCRKYIRENADYLSEYKKEYERTHKEWRRNYSKNYRESHKEEISIRKKIWYENNRDRNYELRKIYMQTYNRKCGNRKYPVSREMRKLHRVTQDFINSHKLRPTKCSMCNNERRIIAHHPNNEIWNEIVWCCDRCHRLIHSWFLECPQPIDLLKM